MSDYFLRVHLLGLVERRAKSTPSNFGVPRRQTHLKKRNLANPMRLWKKKTTHLSDVAKSKLIFNKG